MSGKLQKELKKLRPFDCLEQEVFLNLLRTADALEQGVVELLRPLELSPTQYNVLRILRGAHEMAGEGLACGEIAERMITRDPDVTRLLDRLEKRGLVRRCRQTDDRRVIRSGITEAGLKIVKALDHPIRELHQKQLSHMSEAQLRTLSGLLERAREK